MTDLETRMVVQAYGMYLHMEKELEFSTIDKYKRQAIDYLENPGRKTKQQKLSA